MYGGCNTPESVHQSKRLAEINIDCQQPSEEVTQTRTDDKEREDATYDRICWCEMRMLMALVCQQFLRKLLTLFYHYGGETLAAPLH